jgi:hypothetical protein
LGRRRVWARRARRELVCVYVGVHM